MHGFDFREVDVHRKRSDHTERTYRFNRLAHQPGRFFCFGHGTLQMLCNAAKFIVPGTPAVYNL
jgi:hypothetical protein